MTTMSVAGAFSTIIRLAGGKPSHGAHMWCFPTTAAADRCKGLLETIAPGSTGEVFGLARLYVAPPVRLTPHWSAA